MAARRGVDEVLPCRAWIALGVPVSVRRWLSFVEPEDVEICLDHGACEYALQQTFGKMARRDIPVMALMSENDRSVSEGVDKYALLERWVTVTRANGRELSEGNGISVGSEHNLGSMADEDDDHDHDDGTDKNAMSELVFRVNRFLSKVAMN